MANNTNSKNKRGKLKAAPPSETDGKEDSSLPDPTRTATLVMVAFTLGALILAVVLNLLGLTASVFKPTMDKTANFALFAGFYVAAQVIERLMEVIAPLLPFWKMPTDIGTDKTVLAAQYKADRGKASIGIAAVLGVGASCGLGLFFLGAIGMQVSHTVDAFLTGLTIAAGTKPLHDFTSLLQNQNTPKTGTTT